MDANFLNDLVILNDDNIVKLRNMIDDVKRRGGDTTELESQLVIIKKNQSKLKRNITKLKKLNMITSKQEKT